MFTSNLAHLALSSAALQLAASLSKALVVLVALLELGRRCLIAQDESAEDGQ